jgi:hypothetical protein
MILNRGNAVMKKLVALLIAAGFLMGMTGISMANVDAAHHGSSAHHRTHNKKRAGKRNHHRSSSHRSTAASKHAAKD